MANASPGFISKAARSYHEPAKHDEYNEKFNWIPFWFVAVCVLGVYLYYLVTTNKDAQTCGPQLMFTSWNVSTQDKGCTLYDTAYGDWTEYLQQLIQPQLLLGLPTYVSPTVKTRDSGTAGAYAPFDCTDTFPTNYKSVTVTFYELNASLNLTYLTVSALVDWTPPFLLHIDAILPPWLQPTIPPGSLSLFNYDVRQSLVPTVLPDTNYTQDQVALIVTGYWNLLPFQVEAMMTKACIAFTAGRHLQQCQMCTPVSPTSIAWIIALGIWGALVTLNTVTVYLVQKWNQQYLGQEALEKSNWLLNLYELLRSLC